MSAWENPLTDDVLMLMTFLIGIIFGVLLIVIVQRHDAIPNTKEYVTESKEIGDVCLRICGVSPNAAIMCEPVGTFDEKKGFTQTACIPLDAGSECWYRCVHG
jgi:hypothetical protein